MADNLSNIVIVATVDLVLILLLVFFTYKAIKQHLTVKKSSIVESSKFADDDFDIETDVCGRYDVVVNSLLPLPSTILKLARSNIDDSLLFQTINPILGYLDLIIDRISEIPPITPVIKKDRAVKEQFIYTYENIENALSLLRNSYTGDVIDNEIATILSKIIYMDNLIKKDF